MPLDLVVSRALQSAHAPWLDSFAIAVTFLGAPGTVIIFAFAAAVRFLILRRPVPALALALTAFSLPFSNLLKAVVGRSRPDEDLVRVVVPAVGESFPSGHALGSLVFYGCLCAAFWPDLPRRRRIIAAWAAALLVVAIGWTRVYLGVHWTGDVLGGWLAGALLLSGILALSSRLRRLAKWRT
ncbi:MAG: phosphatase PAP2 family protein [Armatimonadota bacterium]